MAKWLNGYMAMAMAMGIVLYIRIIGNSYIKI